MEYGDESIEDGVSLEEVSVSLEETIEEVHKNLVNISKETYKFLNNIYDGLSKKKDGSIYNIIERLLFIIQQDYDDVKTYETYETYINEENIEYRYKELTGAQEQLTFTIGSEGIKRRELLPAEQTTPEKKDTPRRRTQSPREMFQSTIGTIRGSLTSPRGLTFRGGHRTHKIKRRFVKKTNKKGRKTKKAKKIRKRKSKRKNHR